jgi:hypothetical protein
VFDAAEISFKRNNTNKNTSELKMQWTSPLAQVSAPPLAIHKEVCAISEFTARVVDVCVQNLKQTRASCSQMWGLSGSLTVPGVLGVKATHARSCFSPGSMETWTLKESSQLQVPNLFFLYLKNTESPPFQDS